LLVSKLLGERMVQPCVNEITYREAFIRYLSLDPFTATDEQVFQAVEEKASYRGGQLSRDDALDLLMSVCIEPGLGFKDLASLRHKDAALQEADGPATEQSLAMTFVFDYPASQAALAQIGSDEYGNAVAKRFELYIGGMEIANAYQELSDSHEQAERFRADNKKRAQQGLPLISADEHLVSALEYMPDCAGIAMGLDRLLMLKTGATHIDEVIAFPANRI